VGAGIFVLIGKTINIAGSSAWISVMLGGIFIYWVSSYYIDAHNLYDDNDAEFLAISEAYGKPMSLTFTILALCVVVCIVYVVMLAFGSYFEALVGIPVSIGCLLGLGVSLFINIYGIQITAEVNKLATLSGLSGLALIVVLGGAYILSNFSSVVKKFRIPELHPIYILYGAFIFVFAYTGFEMIIRLNKESIDGSHDIPRAIHHSIIITMIIYILICIVMISVFDSNGYVGMRPFVSLIQKLTSNVAIIKYIEYCGAILTWTTLLFGITQASRLLRDLAYTHNIVGLGAIRDLHPESGVPQNALIAVGVAILCMYGIGISIDAGTIVANGGLVVGMLAVVWCVRKVGQHKSPLLVESRNTAI
jgi:hypothetical protein